MPSKRRINKHGSNHSLPPSSSSASHQFKSNAALNQLKLNAALNHINPNINTNNNTSFGNNINCFMNNNNNNNNNQSEMSLRGSFRNNGGGGGGDDTIGECDFDDGCNFGGRSNDGNLIVKELTLKEQQQYDRNLFLSTLNKDQLKFECRKRGQKTSGTKMELLQRLGFKMSIHHNHNHHQNNHINNNNTDNGLSNNNNNKIQQKSNKSGITSTLNGAAGGGGGGAGGPSNITAASIAVARNRNTKDREKERAERGRILLWRQPLVTLKYCSYESVILLKTYGKKLCENKLIITLCIAFMAILSVGYNVPGKHQAIIDILRNNVWFVVYWMGLGVLSSVGLGTGLHTFILYLGPHIASVTLAAYECNSIDFPKPPYPDEIICPDVINPKFIPTLWNIMSKVRPETILWGAGTALGELPPYFIAKSARLSGYDPDDAEDLQEFEALKKKRESGVDLNVLDRIKLAMERIVERVGFLGILACASIPNPLFDLAGITCGHFLVPFWTFFGATLIGKAVIKTHVQQIFVIVAFSESLVDKAINILSYIPITGKYLLDPFKSFLNNEKLRLHRNDKRPTEQSGNLLAKIFETFVVLMVAYFFVSIINSLAQNYHKRIHKKGATGGIGFSNNNINNIINNNNNRINNHRKVHKE